jgi:hypothetical protein
MSDEVLGAGSHVKIVSRLDAPGSGPVADLLAGA